jgi:hypothetical protein
MPDITPPGQDAWEAAAQAVLAMNETPQEGTR